ncbi:MAG TPA: polysaccharide deacetylase family protein [Amycolatopsis sp.]|uniref:polysaccharide deacetylase family protein n=1 Tax=Amycolatopsis sp. TaxID=37632 RepID=UPI002B4783DC|nr:polysaccharide deacetylase family protein [Amycolatopsis sp.]HKS49639.1 polysaccharide deacetylase family protein [Amycolatopsis sp.]
MATFLAVAGVLAAVMMVTAAVVIGGTGSPAPVAARNAADLVLPAPPPATPPSQKALTAPPRVSRAVPQPSTTGRTRDERAPATTAPRADLVVGSTEQRQGRHIALTFDDGPDPVWTPKVLALLAQYHAKATFCLIGRNALAYPQLVRQIVAAGHALCDHTMNHDEGLSKRSPRMRQTEIANGLRAILATAPGAQVRYFRAPGGAFSKPDFPDSLQRIAAGLGMQPLAWSIDARDWKRPGVSSIVDSIEDAGDHDVVLLHDGGGARGQTVAALGIVLPWLAAHGYESDFPA